MSQAEKRCGTCARFTQGKRVLWAGVCALMGKRADGSPMIVATGARRCYFAECQWQPIQAEAAA